MDARPTESTALETSPYVAILLSTYNPRGHLRPQIESLLAQKLPDGLRLKILIRDDASPDRSGTAQHLETAARLGADLIEIETSPINLGAAKSFLTMLESPIARGAMYVAFCDQDDLWQPGKLARAIDILKLQQRPAMYFSRAELVSESMQPLGCFPSLTKARLSHHNALAENIAIGCTTVLNAAAVRIVCGLGMPRAPSMHDAWCFLVLSVLGSVHYDQVHHYIRYRQHDNNVVGAVASAWARVSGRLLSRLRKFSLDSSPFRDQAASLLELSAGSGIPPQVIGDVHAFVNMRDRFLCRLRYVLNRETGRIDPVENFVFKAKVLLGLGY